MDKIVLTTDSAMCAIKRNDSIIIPTQIIDNQGNSYCDNIDISNRKILEDMKKGIIYKTSSPLLGDFETTFRSILEDGKDVIHLSVGSSISQGSVNGANLIANQLNEEYNNKVYVIDSLTGATGGTLLYELAYQELSNSNLKVNELIEKLNKLKEQIKTAFYVPNIEGYIRSGRDTTRSNLKNTVLSTTSRIAKMAGIKFRVDVNKEGKLFLKNFFRATEEKGMEKMVMDIVNEKTIETFDKSIVSIGSLYKDKVDLEKIKKYLLSFKYFEKIVENDIGSVIAAYGCNDLCGIALMKKLH
ncbi:MAG: DegV family EDD domain-containing protein [Bacilli bacterium]|nr:DegV family EDD domain-containing protein [Bacilli bacterium]